MIILKEREVHSLLSEITVPECHRLLAALHTVLRAYSSSKNASVQDIHQPERESIETKKGNTTLFMRSSITTSTGIKIVTISSKGLKGCINVFGPEGDLRGLLNAEEITAFRTSLAVMIPYIRWAGPKTNIVIFGAGRQAEWHLQLALLLSDVSQVTVANRASPRRMEQLFSNLQKKYPSVSFQMLLKTADDFDKQLRDALSASNVIFCCTPAQTPHFSHDDLGKKSRFISLIGSYKPSMQEVDSETLLSGDCIYVDTIEGCLSEAGELIRAGVKKNQLVEIGQLPDDHQFTAGKSLVFKCVGMGIMDLVMARELLEMATAKNVGLSMDDF
jgi:ornithine cyclodeaminase/alanine dehydrogenase-like protein (mu-crystallin family)